MTNSLQNPTAQLETAVERFLDGWPHFTNSINWDKSHLDADAIAFMNEVPAQLRTGLKQHLQGLAHMDIFAWEQLILSECLAAASLGAENITIYARENQLSFSTTRPDPDDAGYMFFLPKTFILPTVSLSFVSLLRHRVRKAINAGLLPPAPPAGEEVTP